METNTVLKKGIGMEKVNLLITLFILFQQHILHHNKHTIEIQNIIKTDVLELNELRKHEIKSQHRLN